VTIVRSRRAGISAEEARHRPMYARVLGLQYLRPSSLLCFAFFEGAVALSALLALAELAQWWVVLVLPLSVAAMVKLNDVIAGAVLRAGSGRRAPKALGRARVPMVAAHGRTGGAAAGIAPISPAVPFSDDEDAAGDDQWLGSPGQRARQSGMRRYE
jgi:hypothetical protein